MRFLVGKNLTTLGSFQELRVSFEDFLHVKRKIIYLEFEKDDCSLSSIRIGRLNGSTRK